MAGSGSTQQLTLHGSRKALQSAPRHAWFVPYAEFAGQIRTYPAVQGLALDGPPTPKFPEARQVAGFFNFQMRGSSAVEQRVHTPKAARSNRALATSSRLPISTPTPFNLDRWGDERAGRLNQAYRRQHGMRRCPLPRCCTARGTASTAPLRSPDLIPRATKAGKRSRKVAGSFLL